MTTPHSNDGWRKWLRIHPAAEFFPILGKEELRTLAADIKAHGLRQPTTFIEDEDGHPILLDGRSRLDALELLAEEITLDNSIIFERRCFDSDFDVYAFVTSLNIHRRHLTAEKKHELITKLLKAKPEQSDRQIANTVKASPTTVGKVRADMEVKGDVSKLDTRTDTRGRKQPVWREKVRRGSARAQKHTAEAKKRSEDYHEYMDEKISRFAHKLIQLDASLACELHDIIAEGGDAHQLMDDLDTGLKIEKGRYLNVETPMPPIETAPNDDGACLRRAPVAS
jgi:hypothetical protein